MARSNSAQKYASNHKTVIVLLGLGATIYLAWRLRELLILLFLTLILVLALRPLVNWLEKHHFNRRLSAFGIIIIVLAALIGLVFSVTPQLVEQTNTFMSDVPQYIEDFSDTTNINLPSVSDAIDKAGSNGIEFAVNVTSATFAALFSIFAVVTIGYYGLAEYDQAWKRLRNMPGVAAKRVTAIQANIEERLGGWVRGQVILSVLVGIVEFIAYLAFGLPFAGLLAILGAVLAIIPVLGPIAAAVPVMLIALTISTEKAIAVGIVYLVIQLVTAYLFTPKILGKAAGLHPVSVIIALIAGSALGGMIGILLAIPVLVFLIAIYEGATNRHAPLTDA